jgi:hypothetical protein
MLACKRFNSNIGFYLLPGDRDAVNASFSPVPNLRIEKNPQDIFSKKKMQRGM